jgi:hypothetical protein
MLTHVGTHTHTPQKAHVHTLYAGLSPALQAGLSQPPSASQQRQLPPPPVANPAASFFSPAPPSQQTVGTPAGAPGPHQPVPLQLQLQQQQQQQQQRPPLNRPPGGSFGRVFNL